MVLAIRSKRDQDFKILIDKIFGTMGFSGSREQAKSLAKLAKEEWKKRRPGEDMPEMPKGIGWIRRKADKGIYLNRPSMSPPKKKDHPIDSNVNDVTVDQDFNIAISEFFKNDDPSTANQAREATGQSQGNEETFGTTS